MKLSCKLFSNRNGITGEHFDMYTKVQCFGDGLRRRVAPSWSITAVLSQRNKENSPQQCLPAVDLT